MGVDVEKGADCSSCCCCCYCNHTVGLRRYVDLLDPMYPRGNNSDFLYCQILARRCGAEESTPPKGCPLWLNNRNIKSYDRMKGAACSMDGAAFTLTPNNAYIIPDKAVRLLVQGGV